MFSHLLKYDPIPYPISELTFLKGKFRKNGYPENFIDKCFKEFLNNIRLAKENVPSGKKAFAPSPSIVRKNIFGNSN